MLTLSQQLAIEDTGHVVAQRTTHTAKVALVEHIATYRRLHNIGRPTAHVERPTAKRSR